VNRGDVYFAQDMPDSAEASYDRALALQKGEAPDLWRRKQEAFFRLLEKRGVPKSNSDR
jgi:hypothetical protein